MTSGARMGGGKNVLPIYIYLGKPRLIRAPQGENGEVKIIKSATTEGKEKMAKISLAESIKDVVNYLDKLMERQPSRETADACNYLSDLLKKLES